VLVLGLALACTAAFVVFGPASRIGIGAAAVVCLGLAFIAWRPSGSMVLPALGLVLLTPQMLPGVRYFDFVLLGLAGWALWRSLQVDDRRVWDVRTPGLLALISLAVPLAALPGVVVSLSSFVGSYKEFVAYAVLFLSLRRAVDPARSRSLLYVFPVVGSVAAVQLLTRVRGLGVAFFQRLEFRNTYTELGWGESNYVAAILLICLLGTAVATLLERGWRRLPLLAAAGLMGCAFFLLFSRAATISFAVAALFLLVAWGGRKSVLLMAAVFAMLSAVLVSPVGRVLVFRFTDPREYASWYARLLVWEASWQRFLRYPLTGTGLNQGRYQGDELGAGAAHNLVLQVLMEQGILGGVFLIVVGAAIYRLCLRARLAETPAADRTLRVLLLASVTSIFVNSMAEPTLPAYVATLLFVWLIAWLSLQPTRDEAAVPALTAATAPRSNRPRSP
jgi:O-antigen ligase